MLFLCLASFAQETDIFSRPLQSEPSRKFDAVHYRISLRFHEEENAFDGETSVTIKSLQDGLQKCVLDAMTYTVTSVKSRGGQPLDFEHRDGKLIITLSQAIDYGSSVSFTISYHAKDLTDPRGRIKGISFVDESSDNPALIIARSFPNGARHWFPCYDHPSDKATQEVIATVPAGYRALANGKLVDVTGDLENKTRTFHWSQEHPHSTYLSTLVAGPYVVIEDSLGPLPINYWFHKQDEKDAMNSFHRTPEIIAFLGREYGYDYPWEKYDQITVPGGGGAECTSATLLGQNMIHDTRGEQDFSSHWLICHEAAHQWWGDLVTCRDWGHTWINESFGTYSEVQLVLHDSGEEEAAVNLLGKKNQYLYEAYTRYMRPIVSHRWEDPGQNFDRHTYQKGSAVIHMMRWILGETPFHSTLSHFLHKHAFQPADTHDFLTAIKDATGQNLDWFFDQWLLSPGHPIFDVSHTWDEDTRRLKWRIVQTQDTSRGIPIFRTPVILGIVTPEGRRSEKAWIEKQTEVFEFGCEQKPLMVRFDEGNNLLKEWTFVKSVDELLYQLEFDDVIGRMWAASQLIPHHADTRARAALIERAQEDSHWAVRRDTLYILGGYQGVTQMDYDRGNIPWTRLNEGFDPGRFLSEDLIDFLKQRDEDSNSKVRAAALWGLGNLRKKALIPYFQERFQQDDSYRAQAAALVAVGKSGDPAAASWLEKARRIESPTDILRRASDWALEELKRGTRQ